MYRVALIGAGGMAGTHARGYAAIPNAELVGVMDVRADAADSLAGVHGAKGYTDFDLMLSEVRPDVVDVCTPTPFHVDYVCRAAESSGLRPKGIIVEKPMGRTVAECERMIAACDRARIPLFVAQVVRFFPEFDLARQRVLAGAVGKPSAIRTSRGGGYPRGWEDWFGNIDMSGGVVLDLMIHDLDWLRWTFGEVERVFAKGIAGRLPPGARVDMDYALVTLRFKSGAMAHVEGTWADPGGFKVSFEIAGDEGLLEYNFNQPSAPPFQLARKQPESDAAPGVAVPESPVAESPYQLELAHFLRCLDATETPRVTAQDGLEAVRIADAAMESMRIGLPVTLT